MKLDRQATIANYTIHLVNGMSCSKLMEIAQEQVQDMLLQLSDAELADQITDDGIIEFLDDNPTTH